MKPGIYHDISNDDYHGGPGISNSGIDDILQSPYHFYSRHLDPARPAREETSSQLDGNLAHCAILEPDEFANRYVIGPDLHRNSKAWKEFCELHEGKTVIKPDQYTRAMRQRDAVWQIKDAAEALSAGKPEVSAYWIDAETGVLCRCRPDFVHDAGSGVILVDVKTFADASPSEFERQAARMRYYRQDAYYSDGFAIAAGKPVIGFIFIAVEMPWPHSASATMFDAESRDVGRRQYRRALDIYAQCLSENKWPGYPRGIEIIRLPEWAMNAA